MTNPVKIARCDNREMFIDIEKERHKFARFPLKKIKTTIYLQ